MCGKVKHTNHLRTLFCSPKCKTRHRRKEGYLKQNNVPQQKAVTEKQEPVTETEKTVWDAQKWAKTMLEARERMEYLNALALDKKEKERHAEWLRQRDKDNK
jgi:hypothetical protein